MALFAHGVVMVSRDGRLELVGAILVNPLPFDQLLHNQNSYLFQRMSIKVKKEDAFLQALVEGKKTMNGCPTCVRGSKLLAPIIVVLNILRRV